LVEAPQLARHAAARAGARSSSSGRIGFCPPSTMFATSWHGTSRGDETFKQGFRIPVRGVLVNRGRGTPL
jgi:hypothetical protein